MKLDPGVGVKGRKYMKVARGRKCMEDENVLERSPLVQIDALLQ
jgi:hypothetical protein